MDKRKLFIDYMENCTNIALATNAGESVNLRVVSIGFDGAEPTAVYFMTSRDSAKAREIAENPEVVFVPVPDRPDTDVVARVRGKAMSSQIPVKKFAALIGRHLPEFAEQIPAMADTAGFFEIRFDSAEVSLGMEPPEIIML